MIDDVLYKVLQPKELKKVIEAMNESEKHGYACGFDDGYSKGFKVKEIAHKKQIDRLQSRIAILEAKLEVKTDVVA